MDGGVRVQVRLREVRSSPRGGGGQHKLNAKSRNSLPSTGRGGDLISIRPSKEDRHQTAMASAAASAPGPRLARLPLLSRSRHIARRSLAAVASPAPATADVDTRTARELVAWLTVEKGLPGGAAKAVSFGDGGVAKLVNDVRAGEPLIEIPQNLAVTSVDVADSPIVAGLAAGRGELVGWRCGLPRAHKGRSPTGPPTSPLSPAPARTTPCSGLRRR